MVKKDTWISNVPWKCTYVELLYSDLERRNECRRRIIILHYIMHVSAGNSIAKAGGNVQIVKEGGGIQQFSNR